MRLDRESTPSAAASSPELEHELDELYGLPPSAFVAARDALAKRLRGAGDRAAAERVKGLRKPSPVAWAVNRLARLEPQAMAALAELGEQQRRLMAGGGAAAAQRAAREAVLEAVGLLADRAASLLAEEGLDAMGSGRPRVVATLEALAAWGRAAAAPRPGRLDGEVAPPGFDALLGLAAAAEEGAATGAGEVVLGRRFAPLGGEGAVDGRPPPGPVPAQVATEGPRSAAADPAERAAATARARAQAAARAEREERRRRLAAELSAARSALAASIADLDRAREVEAARLAELNRAEARRLAAAAALARVQAELVAAESALQAAGEAVTLAAAITATAAAAVDQRSVAVTRAERELAAEPELGA